MANEDLSKSKIDRSVTVGLAGRKRQPRHMITPVVIVILALFLVVYFRSITAVEIESATVTTAYPSQSFMQFFTISTMNWQSFSELAFGFTLNLSIIIKSFVFALIMGLIGGFLPAVQATHLSIVDSLRAA